MKDILKIIEMDGEIIPLTFLPAFEKLFLENRKYLVMFLNAQTGSKIVYEKSEVFRGYEEVKKPLIHYETNKFNFYITMNKDYIDCNSKENNIFLNPYVSVTFALYEDINKTVGEEKLYQLVINCNPLDDDKGEIKINFSDKDGFTLSFYTAFIKNVEYYRKKYYECHEKLGEAELWLLALNAKTYGELYEIVSKIFDEDECFEFMVKIIEINCDKDILNKWEMCESND